MDISTVPVRQPKEVPMRLSKILPAALVLFVALATPAMAQSGPSCKGGKTLVTVLTPVIGGNGPIFSTHTNMEEHSWFCGEYGGQFQLAGMPHPRLKTAEATKQVAVALNLLHKKGVDAAAVAAALKAFDDPTTKGALLGLIMNGVLSTDVAAGMNQANVWQKKPGG